MFFGVGVAVEEGAGLGFEACIGPVVGGPESAAVEKLFEELFFVFGAIGHQDLRVFEEGFEGIGAGNKLEFGTFGVDEYVGRAGDAEGIIEDDADEKGFVLAAHASIFFVEAIALSGDVGFHDGGAGVNGGHKAGKPGGVFIAGNLEAARINTGNGKIGADMMLKGKLYK